MKRMSCSRRLVRIAARSPGRSMAGPLVMRMATPVSWARMFASVVLPSPGGPVEEQVVQRFATFARGFDGDLDVLLDALLAGELAQ